MIAVVDTNVPIVANGKRSPQASLECVATCARRLDALMKTGKLVLDDGWLILNEYKKHLRSSGQPGPGDAFLKWVLTNRRNPNRCELVTITPHGSDPNNFVEFPPDPRLNGFDPADRKFVAVSRARLPHPPILQAVDPGWWKFRKVLAENGVTTEFLCEADIRRYRV